MLLLVLIIILAVSIMTLYIWNSEKSVQEFDCIPQLPFVYLNLPQIPQLLPYVAQWTNYTPFSNLLIRPTQRQPIYFVDNSVCACNPHQLYRTPSLETPAYLRANAYSTPGQLTQSRNQLTQDRHIQILQALQKEDENQKTDNTIELYGPHASQCYTSTSVYARPRCGNQEHC